MEPKRPLTALLIAPNPIAREDILAGRKRITIRQGHRDYRPDELVMICCQIEPWCVQAKVAEVRHCRIRDLTLEECRADGFQDRSAVVEGLKVFYPNITAISDVTVIVWMDVCGKLVDEYRASHA
jgi:hypothetical protein